MESLKENWWMFIPALIVVGAIILTHMVYFECSGDREQLKEMMMRCIENDGNRCKSKVPESFGCKQKLGSMFGDFIIYLDKD